MTARTNVKSFGHEVSFWEAMAASDVGDPLPLPRGGPVLAVQAKGTFGGTITIEGTINGTDWFTLKDRPGGDDVTFSADGYAEISTGVRAIRPSAGAGVSDVDVFANWIG